jgi:hypothetical protein
LVVQQVQRVYRWMGRAVGLDLHRDFCEVAICEDGVVRSAGRVRMAAEGVEALAASLECTDRVAMEVSAARGRWRASSSLTCSVWLWSRRTTPGSRRRTKTGGLDARRLASPFVAGRA